MARDEDETAASTALALLRESEELNRRIIEAVPGGVVHVSADGAILRANAEALRILGLRYDELTRRYTTDFDTETIREDGTPFAAADYPVTRAIVTGEVQPASVIGVRRKDGTTAWAVFRAVPVRSTSGNEVTGAVVTFLEITERKQAEARVRASEEKWRALAANMVDFAVMLDREGHILFINRLRAGYVLEDVLGKSVSMYTPPEHMPILLENIERVFATGENVRFELKGAGNQGEEVAWYEDSIGPILRDGEVVAVVLIARDITERVDLLQHLTQNERMASVGLLAAGVAHEINNPLAYVQANLGFVLGSWTGDATSRQALVEALEGAMRVRDIVRDLGTFGRDGGVTSEAVDVKNVLDAAIRIAHNEIRHSADLVRAYGNVPCVHANEARLGQVFLNLLVNAAHAIPQGRRGSIFVSTTASGDGAWVTIEVRDTGVGIAPMNLGRIFDPFFTSKSAGAGSGLGLSICSNIVKALGGTLEVESSVGVGSAFRVRLPASREAKTNSEPDRRELDRDSWQILVVDDDAFVARAFVRMLSPPHKVSVALNGTEALELIAKHSFDIVLCDVMMPGKTGLDLHAEAELRDPAVADRFVFITGGAFAPEIDERLRTAGRPFLRKPIEPRELLAAIKAEMESRRPPAIVGSQT